MAISHAQIPHTRVPVVGNQTMALEWWRALETLFGNVATAQDTIYQLQSQLGENAQAIEDLQNQVDHLTMSASQGTDLPTPAMSDTPIGAFIPFGGTAIPDGFLTCEGQAVSRTTYAALYTVIGVAFGVGDGSSTFNVPNMPGNFVRGSGGGTGIHIGDTGGSSGPVNLAHTHTVTVPSIEVQSGTGTNVGQTGTFTSSSALGSTDTLPPWVASKWIIRYA